MVVSDIAVSLHEDALRRAAAVLITAHAPMQSGPWLERQVEWLRSRNGELPIMVTVDGNELATAEVLIARLGLQGYLPLSSSVDVAAAAIRLIVAGGAYFPRIRSSAGDAAAPILLDRAPAAAEPDIAIFTPRERAVLELLGRGLPNKLIAYELNMSLGTVKVHVHNIISKFKVRNRTGAAVAARTMQFGRQPPGVAAGASAKPIVWPAAAVAAYPGGDSQRRNASRDA